ncbi:hypothetical protein P167DRAFT_308470 [Morchella conica CCBAS932]|uniref:Uncharacterized protein n=1 Tax=Morchella conica CCBAS932 TaxID=1392247 RepID=A0A3N4KFG7_9PEZI|nr:hypothetical protein P167DRAFT_308470 [Morchella conica CCBAS932]
MGKCDGEFPSEEVHRPPVPPVSFHEISHLWWLSAPSRILPHHEMFTARFKRKTISFPIIKAPRFNFPRWSSLFLAVSTGSIDSDCLPEVAAILTAKLFIPEYPLVPPPA